MRTKIFIAAASAALFLAPSFAFAQGAAVSGTNSADPQRGAGAGGVGAPAQGPSSNQPGQTGGVPTTAPGATGNNGTVSNPGAMPAPK